MHNCVWTRERVFKWLLKHGSNYNGALRVLSAAAELSFCSWKCSSHTCKSRANFLLHLRLSPTAMLPLCRRTRTHMQRTDLSYLHMPARIYNAPLHVWRLLCAQQLSDPGEHFAAQWRHTMVITLRWRCASKQTPEFVVIVGIVIKCHKQWLFPSQTRTILLLAHMQRIENARRLMHTFIASPLRMCACVHVLVSA